MSSSASEFSTRSQPTCCRENRHEVTNVILGAANSRVDGKGMDELREEIWWRKWAGPAERIGDKESRCIPRGRQAGRKAGGGEEEKRKTATEMGGLRERDVGKAGVEGN